jgi:hypothetical protein
VAPRSDPVPAASRTRTQSPWLGNPPNGRWTAITAAAAVVVIAAGAATLIEHGRAPARPGGRPAATTRPSGQRTRDAGSASRPRTQARPVTVAAVAASEPHAAAIAAFLTRYFDAIDRHSYRQYRLLFSPSSRGALTAAGFTAGYGTTRDTHAVLRGLSTIAGGQVKAVVTFTSHQHASDSPTHTTCTTWSISLYLARTSSGYVIDSPPDGYKPSFQACS